MVSAQPCLSGSPGANIFYMKKTFAVKVYWEMSAEIEVSAKSEAEAKKKALDLDIYNLLDMESADNNQIRLEVVPDSVNVDPDDIQEI